MIDGRTIETGTLPFVSVNACSPSALVNAYASGQPTLARTRPAGLDEFVVDPLGALVLGLRGERRCTRGAELARASRRKRVSMSGAGSGLEVAAQASHRRRPRCASSRPMSNGPSLTSSSGALPRRLPAT